MPAKIVIPVELPAEKRFAVRRVNFSGAHNFRDLGGYQTVDGATVRWGCLYRSDTLNQLTPADLKEFPRLQLDRLIDLRADLERDNEPDRLPVGEPIHIVHLPILDANSQVMADNVRAQIKAHKVKGLDTSLWMKEAYEHFVSRYSAQYSEFFRQLLEADGKPLLFHCTGGKDRTGFAAALILRILGVPQSTVMADYMLTQKYWQRASSKVYFFVFLARGPQAVRVIKQLTGAKEEYLETAFTTIDSLYGSFDAYVREGLALTPADIARLQQLLLEPAP